MASRNTANFIWCLQIENLCWGQRGTWSWSQNVQNLTLNLKANSRFWFDPHWGWKWRIKLPILNFPPGGTKFSVLRVKFRESKSAIFFGSIWAILLVYYIEYFGLDFSKETTHQAFRPCEPLLLDEGVYWYWSPCELLRLDALDWFRLDAVSSSSSGSSECSGMGWIGGAAAGELYRWEEKIFRLSEKIFESNLNLCLYRCQASNNMGSSSASIQISGEERGFSILRKCKNQN